MKEQSFSKIVSTFSGDYERNQKEKTKGNKYLQMASIFGVTEIIRALKGSSEVGVVEFMPMELLDDPAALEKPELQKVIAELRKVLVQKNNDPAYSYAVKEFFLETIPEDYDEPVDFFKEISGKKLVVIEKIPDRTFLRMLLLHSALYIKKMEDFKSREPKLKKDFLKRFHELTSQGAFEADFDSIVARTNQTEVHLRDTLSHELAEKIGEFNPNRDIAYVSAQVPEEMAADVYCHEFLHAASANATLLASLPKMEDIDPSSGLVRRGGLLTRLRIGLAYSNGKEGELRWLNEAVTEDLTSLFIQKDTGDIYQKERKLFELLRKRGKNLLPKKLFFNAYFEDTVPGEIREPDKIKDSAKLQALLAAVDESFGKNNFLSGLEDFIAKNGLDKAIAALEADPGSIE